MDRRTSRPFQQAHGAFEDAPRGLPTLDALGAVVRRTSLIAAAVHACEAASAEAKMRRASSMDAASDDHAGEGC